MSTDIIQAHYDQLETIAGRFKSQAEANADQRSQIVRCVQALQQAGWEGRGAAAFFAEMEEVVFPAMQRLTSALEEAGTTTMRVKNIIRQAEEEAAAVFNGRDIFNRGELREDRRTDRDMNLRIEADERWRRPPGGDRQGSHSDYDWAGGAILNRYLTGGDDWYINEDPRWTKYMQSNPSLTENLQDRAIQTAQQLLQSGSTQTSIDEHFPMEIENGEGVVGYQYLHGTNANVGGFQRQGTATIVPDGQGGYIASMDLKYTWNDVIDPNPQYSTDRWKSVVAEVITLGQADPYEIHISWAESTVVHLDANGNPISIKNE